MLTRSEIIKQTGISGSVLDRYLAEPENRKILGGEATHPEYAEEMLPQFLRLAALHAAGAITPKTYAPLCRALMDAAVVSPQITNSEIRNAETETALLALPEQATTLLERLVDMTAERIACRALSPVEDRLITAQEAAELLCCKPRSVKRYVLPVRPGVYKRSAVLRFIQSL